MNSLTLPQAAMLHALARTVSRRAQKRYVREVTGQADAKALDAALVATLRKYGKRAIDTEIDSSLMSVWIEYDGALPHVHGTPVGATLPSPALLSAAAIRTDDFAKYREELLRGFDELGLPTDPAIRGAARRVRQSSRTKSVPTAIDEWIIGEGLELHGRWYVLHAHYPVFVAVQADDSQWSLTQLGGLIFTPEENAGWIERAAQALADYDTCVQIRAMPRHKRLRLAEDA